MEILNLGGAAERNNRAPKSRKKLRVILGIGALAAVTGIGSTLAANISLNGGGNVEFGQGVATTAACDNDITLTPVSEFSNTEEDATFALNEIQISHIDLTPEGWDFAADSWATGFTPKHYDSENGIWVDESWDSAHAQYAGKYFDGSNWISTCANKSLMIHAYTDDSNFDYATDGWDTSTPLILNGANGHRPDNNYPDSGNGPSGYNRGVGYRFSTYDFYLNGNVDWNDWNMVEDNHDWSQGATWSGQDYDYVLNGDGNTWNNSTVYLYIGENSNNPPVDSKMVDKLTIESAATTPSGWWEDL